MKLEMFSYLKKTVWRAGEIEQVRHFPAVADRDLISAIPFASKSPPGVSTEYRIQSIDP